MHISSALLTLVLTFSSDSTENHDSFAGSRAHLEPIKPVVNSADVLNNHEEEKVEEPGNNLVAIPPKSRFNKH